jgi:transcriptional regulator with PAS, ATPase and Fis domain
MFKTANFIEKIAGSPSSIYIHGESGTGKEVVAHTIHKLSAFSRAPFVAINCGAISDSLIESELFGCVKGAYTGALNDRPGKIRSADGGTLFLDEIGDLPAAAQTRLLRVLQERRVCPVGGTSEIPVQFRLICATHRDLQGEIAAARFREDLFYRINVFQVDLPPLRQRMADLSLLCRALWESLCLKSGEDRQVLLDDELDVLRDHDWPGNIRELQNVLERYFILGEHGYSLKSLIPPRRKYQDPVDQAPKSRTHDRNHILEVLESTGFNKVQTARLLGISRGSLSYQMKIMGLEQPPQKMDAH